MTRLKTILRALLGMLVCLYMLPGSIILDLMGEGKEIRGRAR